MTGFAVVAEPAADGATAGSSPGRGLMVEINDLDGSNVRTVPDKDTSARQPLFNGTCKEPGCHSDALVGDDYCGLHKDRDRVRITPSPNPQPDSPSVGFDDDQLNRIERKLDALLEHLAVEDDDG